MFQNKWEKMDMHKNCRENFRGKKYFRENLTFSRKLSRKVAHFRLIFDVRDNWKQHFSFQT
jgi:hypothetical protein